MLTGMMQSMKIDGQEWPSLDGRVARDEKEGTDWELLEPEDSLSSTTSDGLAVKTSQIELHHCASSPDFHHSFVLLDSVVEEEGSHAADDSFTMVSGPKSVVSVSSGFSFRDAILSPSRNTESRTESIPVNRTMTPQRRAVKPKFVVTPIRRCAKSTGDLQSLNKIEEDHEVLGDTDAMDFYHRKAAGAKNRSSGLKLRPDERKRKEITLQKKAMQRSQKC